MCKWSASMQRLQLIGAFADAARRAPPTTPTKAPSDNCVAAAAAAAAASHVTIPAALLRDLLHYALRQRTLPRAAHASVCALSAALLPREAVRPSARPALARLERLPHAVLGAVFAYLDTLSLVGALVNTSRELRARVCAPGAVHALYVDSGEGAAKALAKLAPATWAQLRRVELGRALEPEDDSEIEAPAFARCLRRLTSSVRHLRLEEFAGGSDALALPPAIWNTLDTCVVTSSGKQLSHLASTRADCRIELPSFGRSGEGLPLGGEPGPHARSKAEGALPVGGGGGLGEESPSVCGELPALRRLALWGDENDAQTSPYTNRRFVGFLRAACGGELRVLSLQLPPWHTADLAAALVPLAPGLEALALSEYGARTTVFVIPPLPRLHTLSLSNEGDRVVTYRLPAVERSELRHLQVSGPIDLEASVAPATEGKGAGWTAAAPGLHTLSIQHPQSYGWLWSHLRPAVGRLRVLRLTFATNHRVAADAADIVGFIHYAAATIHELQLDATVPYALHRTRHELKLEALSPVRICLEPFVALRVLRMSPELQSSEHHDAWRERTRATCSEEPVDWNHPTPSVFSF